MGLQEQIEEFNKKPNAKYAYIGLIIAFLFTIAAIADPDGTAAMIFAIFGLLLWFAVVYLIFKFCCGSENQQQQQQQQQQVLINNSNKKVRVCPKCGLQNDIDSKFCSDCGHELKIGTNQ